MTAPQPPTPRPVTPAADAALKRLEADAALERLAVDAANLRTRGRFVVTPEMRADIATLITLLADYRARIEAQAATFEDHTRAVSDFLNELYAIMVNPCAEGALTVAEVKETLIKSATLSREAGARIEALEGAIKPFVAVCVGRESWSDDREFEIEVPGSNGRFAPVSRAHLRLGEFRHARAALTASAPPAETRPEGESQ